MNQDKELLLKRARLHDLSAKYLSLPCVIVSGVLTLAATVAGDKPLAILNCAMFALNCFGLWLNTYTRDRLVEQAEQFNELDRMQRIRDLNPHK